MCVCYMSVVWFVCYIQMCVCYVSVVWFVCYIQMQGDDDTTLLPKCLMLYGDWLAETRSQSPNVILEKYLSKVAA